MDLQLVSPVINWSNVSDEKLVELYNAKYTHKEIGTLLNVTRSAVAGKIGRIKQTGKFTFIEKRTGFKPRKAKQAQPKPPKMFQPKSRRTELLLAVAPVQRPIRIRMIDSETAVTLLDLEGYHCRWPIGDPRLADFRYCGCSRISKSDRTPYCKAHTKQAGKPYETTTAPRIDLGRVRTA